MLCCAHCDIPEDNEEGIKLHYMEVWGDTISHKDFNLDYVKVAFSLCDKCLENIKNGKIV
jgi:hypothetical protein